MMPDDMDLLMDALAAMEKAYCPYSGFSVGAALLAADGKVYTGCNVENAAYSACICAERVAFSKAVSEGNTEFLKIAVVGKKKGSTENEQCLPCGECRQVMSEFCKGDFVVITQDEEKIYNYKLSELLPASFKLKK